MDRRINYMYSALHCKLSLRAVKKLKTASNTSVSVHLYLHTDSIVSKEYLRVVGKISCVYRSITAHVPEIPHLPIMVNVILTGISEVSPANEKQSEIQCIYRPQRQDSVHADDHFSAQQHNAIER